MLAKIDGRKFSGMVSQCVEWSDPTIERTNREASSLSFLQEKIKHPKLSGHSYSVPHEEKQKQCF